jgi:LysM repeat protein
MVRRLLSTAVATAALAALVPADGGAAGYRVRWGDTLTAIAARYGTSLQALAAANRLDPARTLVAGTTLVIPVARPSTYRVRVGDTLSAIAARYGTSVGALAAANRLDPSRFLLAGATLRLPSGATGAPIAVPVAVVPASSARYRVQVGDSLSAIAARFGTSVSALAAANRIDPAGILFAGTTLAVPGTRAAPVGEARAPVSHGTVRSLIVYWSGVYGVDPQLALALAWMESGYQATVVSSAGAFGPMQVTSDTREFVEAVLVGSPVPHTTSGDVRVGVAYLHYLLGRFGGSERLALAGYFQGPASVKNGLLPETKAYIADVLSLKSRV